MIKMVADSSALILLAKCNLLKVLCNSYKVLAPSSVIEETASKELLKKYPDSLVIADLVSGGKIKVQDPKNVDFLLPVTLDQGERDALLTAMELKKTMVATDDGKAIKAAKFLNVPFIITPRIVIDLFNMKKISREHARKAIEKLNVIGRYSPDIIAHALLTLTEETK